MKYEKRFEAREIVMSELEAKIDGKIWRVWDLRKKGWWSNRRNQSMNVDQALLIADSLNNGHIRP